MRTNITIALLSIFGIISLSVAGGFIVMSFKGLSESTIHRDLGHFQIMDKREKSGESDYPLEFGIEVEEFQKISEVLETKGAKVVMPRINFSGIASNDEKSTIFLGEGILPDKESSFSSVFIEIVKGRDLGLDFYNSEKREAIIGVDLAKLLSLDVGDVITLMVSTVDGAINAIDLEVSGVFTTGIEDVDKRLIKTPLWVSKEILRTEKISKVVVGLESTENSKSFFDSLHNSWREKRLSLYFWEDLAPFYQGVVNLYTVFFIFLGSLIFLMVFSTVFTSVYSSIVERTKEIGVLKANGFSKGDILKLIVLEAFFLGGFVGICGFILSHLIIEIVNFSQLTMPPPPGNTKGYPLQLSHIWIYSFYIAIGTSLVIVVSSIKPAIKASRLKVAEALRS